MWVTLRLTISGSPQRVDLAEYATNRMCLHFAVNVGVVPSDERVSLLGRVVLRYHAVIQATDIGQMVIITTIICHFYHDIWLQHLVDSQPRSERFTF